MTAMSLTNTRRDKSSHNRYVPIVPLNQIDLESFYVGSWLARAVVDCVAEDMTREWLTYKWDGHESNEDDVDALADTTGDVLIAGMRLANKMMNIGDTSSISSGGVLARLNLSFEDCHCLIGEAEAEVRALARALHS